MPTTVNGGTSRAGGQRDRSANRPVDTPAAPGLMLATPERDRYVYAVDPRVQETLWSNERDAGRCSGRRGLFDCRATAQADAT
jgi:hypothetical protein